MIDKIQNNDSSKKYSFDEFIDIIRILRGENGCPWDKEQTHESLKTPMIEECYEAVEAINNKDISNLREELGDILLQIALHSVIAEEEKEFTINDVIDEVAKKMIRRHPHVFSKEQVANTEEVLERWESIKKEEKQEESEIESIKKVPRAFPASIRAQKVLKKAARAGYGVNTYEEALEKIQEALHDMKTLREEPSKDEIDDKYGSLLLGIVNLSIFLGSNAENSLTNATDKFINNL
ncbi:nucleoside triphosphate pyrophosphohydrolase [Anaeromicropila herbilytica]|uniref:NTP pyrophosphohydrolase MazG-like domain-containing protein n=1 Tax=Anaeromicropila herbilytica TaxID=2785025 RepID=A0A7R7EHS9_9FIRM|nr:nucleoside triphosphate pyrophosphohydrolase [Anaeromicropila herbilytica]BCN28980.1 hypothetical protein bsdtb5_02750 [Anaeromicropila herbilytica]